MLVKTGWITHIDTVVDNPLPAWAPVVKKRARNIGTVKDPYYVQDDEMKGLLNDQGITRKINLYIRSKKWGLPFPGGWMNQPAWIMEVFDILDNVEAAHG